MKIPKSTLQLMGTAGGFENILKLKSNGEPSLVEKR